MRTTVTVFFEDGDFFSTEINLSFEEAKKYYEGNTFNVGLGPEDNLKKCTHIELFNEKANLIRILAKRHLKKNITFSLEESNSAAGLTVKADVEEDFTLDEKTLLVNELLRSTLVTNAYWKDKVLYLVFK